MINLIVLACVFFYNEIKSGKIKFAWPPYKKFLDATGTFFIIYKYNNITYLGYALCINVMW